MGLKDVIKFKYLWFHEKTGCLKIMQHTILCTTTMGLEGFAETEVKKLVSAKCTKKIGSIEFETSDLTCVIGLSYTARVIESVLIKICEFRFTNLQNLLLEASKYSYHEFLKKGKTIALSAERDGSHDFNSGDAEKELAGVILESIKKNKGWRPKVDLKYPDFTFKIIIKDNNCIVGVDASGFDLNKRGYKIFHSTQPLRPSVANAMIELNGWSWNNIFLDPSCGDGVLAIEAALKVLQIPSGQARRTRFAFNNWGLFKKEEIKREFDKYDLMKKDLKLKIRGMDKFMQNVEGGNRNARIAGVARLISFSRCDLEWIDEKYDEKSVDSIIVFPPSKRVGRDVVNRFYKDLFFQAGYLLKGRMTILTDRMDAILELAKDYKLKVKKRISIDYMGEGNELVNIER